LISSDFSSSGEDVSFGTRDEDMATVLPECRIKAAAHKLMIHLFIMIFSAILSLVSGRLKNKPIQAKDQTVSLSATWQGRDTDV
jgi:hypothetical protein